MSFWSPGFCVSMDPSLPRLSLLANPRPESPLSWIIRDSCVCVHISVLLSCHFLCSCELVANWASPSEIPLKGTSKPMERVLVSSLRKVCWKTGEDIPLLPTLHFCQPALNPLSDARACTAKVCVINAHQGGAGLSGQASLPVQILFQHQVSCGELLPHHSPWGSFCPMPMTAPARDAPAFVQCCCLLPRAWRRLHAGRWIFSLFAAWSKCVSAWKTSHSTWIQVWAVWLSTGCSHCQIF